MSFIVDTLGFEGWIKGDILHSDSKWAKEDNPSLTFFHLKQNHLSVQNTVFRLVWDGVLDNMLQNTLPSRVKRSKYNFKISNDYLLQNNDHAPNESSLILDKEGVNNARKFIVTEFDIEDGVLDDLGKKHLAKIGIKDDDSALDKLKYAHHFYLSKYWELKNIHYRKLIELLKELHKAQSQIHEVKTWTNLGLLYVIFFKYFDGDVLERPSYHSVFASKLEEIYQHYNKVGDIVLSFQFREGEDITLQSKYLTTLMSRIQKRIFPRTDTIEKYCRSQFNIKKKADVANKVLAMQKILEDIFPADAGIKNAAVSVQKKLESSFA